ncbi:MAG: hypothetical protein QNJ16_05460 [Rhodobacter sp.]|nr:hypothetical protein [Rhodobacter sp.]
MSGNASRYSFQKERRYSQQILSQGAMVTDADQREGMAIGLRNTTALGDTSIRTGVPQTGGVVRWSEELSPSAHKVIDGIGPGKVVADGHVGEVRAEDGASLEQGAGLDLLHQQQDLLGAPEIDAGAQPVALFADLWHRHVGPAEDPRLVDPAFLSAETSTRTELMAQLKLAPTPGELTDAEIATRVQDNGLPRVGDFRLTEVAFTNEIIEPDDCDPCATTLEDPNQDAGNDLFRLEVHASHHNKPNMEAPSVPAVQPEDTRVILKWSRDNGHVEVPVSAADTLLSDSAFDTAVFELTWLAAEQRLGLYTAGMTDRLATLHARSDIKAAMAAAPEGAMLRVWDGAVRIDLDEDDLAPEPVGTLTVEGSMEVTDGIWTLSLDVGGLDLVMVADDIETVPYVLPGDAWSVEIREYATETGDKLIWHAEPVEVEHHYTFIGMIEGEEFRNEAQPDMRARAFPALTELDALDIGYDNSQSEAKAWTVQGALDLLFARPQGEGHDCHCTFCINPKADLAEQLTKIAENLSEEENSHALICIPAGRFELVAPVEFRNGVAVTLRGAGRDLTVLEVAKAKPNLGMVNFFGLKSCRLEEMSFVGDMQIDDPESRTWVVGVHDVGDFEAWRISMRVARSDDGMAQGIVVAPVEKSVAGTNVTVRESIFRVAAGAQAIGVWRGAASLKLENNQFRSINFETFGGAGKLSASNDLVARTAVDRRTLEREALIAQNLFAPYPGNSELLLNFTDLPPDVRPGAERYWTLALRMLKDSGEIGEPEEFAKVKSNLTTIHAASNRLLEAENMARVARAPGPGIRGGPRRLPVLAALTGKDTRPTFGKLGAGTPGLVGNFTKFRPILAAGGSIDEPVTTGDDLSASDKAALKLVNTANGLIAGDIKVAGFIGQMATVLGLVADNKESGPPNWGVFSFTNTSIPATITGNAFVELDVAIDLAANETDLPADFFTAPRRTNISDNRIRRIIRFDRVFPPEWGEGAEGIFEGRQPITLTNYEDVTVDNNAIAQVLPDNMGLEQVQPIYEPNFPTGMSSFSAITFNGRVGPKLRAVGNSAYLLRHCVFVNARPWKTSLDADHPPSNHFVLRENSALPYIRREVDMPAVHLSDQLDAGVNITFRLVINDNWLPNKKHET